MKNIFKNNVSRLSVTVAFIFLNFILFSTNVVAGEKVTIYNFIKYVNEKGDVRSEVVSNNKGQIINEEKVSRSKRRLVCGDEALRWEKRTWAIGSTDFELNPDGTSHLAFPFVETDWYVETGSAFHVGDDHYADDWNWGVGDADEGKIAIAAAPGYVIFAGRKPKGDFAGYGNQVVVQVVDENGDLTGFAYR